MCLLSDFSASHGAGCYVIVRMLRYDSEDDRMHINIYKIYLYLYTRTGSSYIYSRRENMAIEALNGCRSTVVGANLLK